MDWARGAPPQTPARPAKQNSSSLLAPSPLEHGAVADQRAARLAAGPTARDNAGPERAVEDPDNRPKQSSDEPANIVAAAQRDLWYTSSVEAGNCFRGEVHLVVVLLGPADIMVIDSGVSYDHWRIEGHPPTGAA